MIIQVILRMLKQSRAESKWAEIRNVESYVDGGSNNASPEDLSLVHSCHSSLFIPAMFPAFYSECHYIPRCTVNPPQEFRSTGFHNRSLFCNKCTLNSTCKIFSHCTHIQYELANYKLNVLSSVLFYIILISSSLCITIMELLLDQESSE